MNDKEKKKKFIKIPLPRRSKTMIQCKQCGKQFSKPAALVKHLFKEHPIK